MPLNSFIVSLTCSSPDSFSEINEFKGVEYIHLRKYYLDFDGDFKPTKDGVAMPLTFENSRRLFEGLVEVISLAEAKEILETHFKDILDEIYLS